YRFAAMSQEDAEAIAEWHYPAPFSFYGASADPNDIAELRDPALRGAGYESVRNESGDLVGFFQFKQNRPDAIEIGLGLRPDLTGRGLGGAFLEAGLGRAPAPVRPTRIVLSVATFNRRAITVYERAGFAAVRTYMHST